MLEPSTRRRSREDDHHLTEEDYHDVHPPNKKGRAFEKLPARLYWTFFFYGFTFLLPWNVVLVELPFFVTRIRGTGFEKSFTSYVLTIASLALLVFLWHATSTSERRFASKRAIQSLYWITGLNIKLLFMAIVPLPPTIFALLVLLNAVGQSVGAAYLQTSFWAIGALFGSDAIQALSVGGAAVGAVVGVMQVTGAYFSLIADDGVNGGTGSTSDPARSSAIMLFSLTTLFLLFNIWLQMRLSDTPEYRDFVLGDDESVPMEELENLMSERPKTKPKNVEGVSAREMLWVNASYNCSIGYIFVVTMILFPAVTGYVESVNATTSNSVWAKPLLFNAVHFLLFNLGDLISRYFPLIPSLFLTSSRHLAIMSYARTIFIPLFLLCNVSPPKAPVLNSDILFQLLVFLLGLSNGYLSATIQIVAASLEYNPNLNHRRTDIDTASTVLGFALTIGLALGSALSFAAKAAICGGCNPFVE